jgi:cytochrome b pre-mRNA-processing protein 3
MYFKFFLKFFNKRQDSSEIKIFYDNVVSLARNEDLYIKGGVPDTIDGRFELIILHCHLFIKKLISLGNEEKLFSQNLINYMITDFDRSLREIGVGDLSVGKKIKFMVSAYYGRANAYDRAIKDHNKTLGDVLKKNLYGTIKPKTDEIIYMKKYIKNFLYLLNSTKGDKVKAFFEDKITIKKIS